MKGSLKSGGESYLELRNKESEVFHPKKNIDATEKRHINTKLNFAIKLFAFKTDRSSQLKKSRAMKLPTGRFFPDSPILE